MEIRLWVCIGVLAVTLVTLLVKIHLLQKAAREIGTAFAEKLITETNTLIDVSTGDRYMRGLASAINVQLRKLRAQRHRFQQGDAELKHAVTNILHDLRIFGSAGTGGSIGNGEMVSGNHPKSEGDPYPGPFRFGSSVCQSLAQRSEILWD